MQKKHISAAGLLLCAAILICPFSAENLLSQNMPPPEHDGKIMIPPQGDEQFPDKKAFHGGPGRMFASPMIKNPQHLQTLLDKIGVSKETSSKIITISKNFFKSLDTKMIKVQRYDLDIREEILKDKPDLSSIQNLINKKTQVFGDIEFSQIKRDVEIKALLSETEFEKWKNAVMQGSRFHNGNMRPKKNNDKDGMDHPMMDCPAESDK